MAINFETDKIAPFTVKTEVTAQRVNDLLTSAFEGGSNYWIISATREGATKEQAIYRQDVPFVEGGKIIIVADDNQDDATYTLDRAALEKGLQIMAEKHPRHWGDFTAENDDAKTGDVFLQLCLFGTIVFG